MAKPAHPGDRALRTPRAGLRPARGAALVRPGSSLAPVSGRAGARGRRARARRRDGHRSRSRAAGRRAATVTGLDQSPDMLARRGDGSATVWSWSRRRPTRCRFPTRRSTISRSRTSSATSTSPAATLGELARVVRPGGTIATLEFCVPRGVWRPLWDLYVGVGLPALGRISPGWYDVGRFLGPSILGFYERYPLSVSSRSGMTRVSRRPRAPDQPRRRRRDHGDAPVRPAFYALGGRLARLGDAAPPPLHGVAPLLRRRRWVPRRRGFLGPARPHRARVLPRDGRRRTRARRAHGRPSATSIPAACSSRSRSSRSRALRDRLRRRDVQPVAPACSRSALSSSPPTTSSSSAVASTPISGSRSPGARFPWSRLRRLRWDDPGRGAARGGLGGAALARTAPPSTPVRRSVATVVAVTRRAGAHGRQQRADHARDARRRAGGGAEAVAAATVSSRPRSSRSAYSVSRRDRLDPRRVPRRRSRRSRRPVARAPARARACERDDALDARRAEIRRRWRRRQPRTPKRSDARSPASGPTRCRCSPRRSGVSAGARAASPSASAAPARRSLPRSTTTERRRRRAPAGADRRPRARASVISRHSSRASQRQPQAIAEVEARIGARPPSSGSTTTSSAEPSMRLREELERAADAAVTEALDELEAQTIERRRAIEEITERLRARETAIAEGIEQAETDARAASS